MSLLCYFTKPRGSYYFGNNIHVSLLCLDMRVVWCYRAPEFSPQKQERWAFQQSTHEKQQERGGQHEGGGVLITPVGGGWCVFIVRQF
mmetsp:Transcript_9309/g.17086  ORF Transcript_9309/g.17086 Transcript_9309/m.17086 type:complete len:88 (-) Transcript_9309:453-716(-)